MAPKRAEAPGAPSAAPAKKPKTAPGLDRKVGHIADAIDLSDELPEPTKRMLRDGIWGAIKDPRGSRHPFQKTVVGWIGDTLTSVEASLRKAVAEAESKANDGAAEKERREATQASALAAADKSATDAASKKDASVEAELAVENAKTVLAEALEAQEDGDAELRKTESAKVSLEEGMIDAFWKLKKGGIVGAEQAELLSIVTSMSNALELDASMMTSIPNALSKEPEERGSFGSLVVTQFEEEVDKRLAAFSEMLKAGEPAKKQRAARVEDAREKLDAATTTLSESQAAAEAADEVHKVALTKLKEAVKAVKSYNSDMKALSAHLVASQKDLTHLEKGPLSMFKELEAFDGAATSTLRYETIDGVSYEKGILAIAAKETKPLSLTSVENLWAWVKDASEVSACEKRTMEYILNQYEFAPEAKADLEAKLASVAVAEAA